MSTNVLKRRSHPYGACVIPVLLACPLFADNLSLQISSETAPAGGWAQIKVYSATPQLVASGRILMKFDPAVFAGVAGVAAFSAQGDAVGVATVNGLSLDVTFSSQAGGIAQLPHLPVLTVTVAILASAPAGTVIPITLDASRQGWLDAHNNNLPVTASPGSVTVGGNLSVRDVALAGTLVRIRGTGFSAATTASMDGVSVANVQLPAPGELDLTLGGPNELTGKRMVLRNPDGEQIENFCATPSVPDQAPANTAFLQPMLSMQTWAGAGVQFTLRGGSIALQNPNAAAVDVILQSQNSFLPGDNQTTVTVPAGALVIYSDGSAAESGFLAFAPLPMKMLGLGYPPPNGGIYPIAPFPALPPPKQLAAIPATVSFQWQSGTAVPVPVSISLSPLTGSLRFYSFQAAAPAPFSVTSKGTVAPTTLTVSVNPAGLKEGTYTGDLIVTPDGPNAIPTTIPLSLTISSAAMLYTTPQTVALNGPGDSSVTLTVQSNGNPIAFTAAASDGAGPHWLTVTPSSGTTPGKLTVSAGSANLSQGKYTGQILITGPNNSVTVPVAFDVSNANLFSFSPQSVTFSVQAGSDPPPAQTVLVFGPSSGAAFSASTSSGGPWLGAALTPSGQLGAVITVNPAGLKAGTYAGSVTMTSPYSPFPSDIPVTLVIWNTEPLLTVAPSSVTYTVSLGDNVNTSTPPVVHVDSGGVPMDFTTNTVRGVQSTPASIPAPVGASGRLGTTEYDITITGGTQTVVVPVTTIVNTSPQTPPLLGSVVNAASQLPGSVAPGEIVTIFGFGAGPSNTAGFTLDPSGKVATSLNGAQVLFDGHPAPMIYGSAMQANVIVPYEVAGQKHTVVSLLGTAKSAAWTVPVAASAPGIFTLASSGVGPAAVLNQDNTVNDISHPAARGSIIQIFATGEGQTSPPGVTGAVTGTDLKTPLLSVKVTIGGQDALVEFAGSAGKAVSGLFQVNAVVPQTVAPGKSVPIAISVGGVASQDGVTIAVQ
jgi:uncharacterized protein (TIGR03437 family)